MKMTITIIMIYDRKENDNNNDYVNNNNQD